MGKCCRCVPNIRHTVTGVSWKGTSLLLDQKPFATPDATDHDHSDQHEHASRSGLCLRPKPHMVFGSDVGVVLRARRGRNILVQSHGLDVKAITQAATEVAAVLEGDLPSSIELIDTGAGHQSSLACGHLRVLGNRYAVVYRLLHQVLVIVVSRAHANVFSCLNLAAGISRLLVAEAKSIELTPERLLKKYAQVYLSIDALVNRGSLDLVGALMEASAVLDSLSPDAVRQRKARAQADRLAAATAAGKQIRQIGRRVPEPHHDHGRFSFKAPPELTSLQVNIPVYQLPELPAPDRPIPTAKSAGIAVPLLEEKQPEEEKKEEGEQPWTAFEQDQQQEVAKPTLLQYEGPPLHLQETWQVEVLGSKVLRAGLVGAVRWAAPEAKALSGSTPFRLQAPAEPDQLVSTALKCALLSDKAGRIGPVLGTFIADTLSPLPAAAAVLQYNLPATYGVLPLMAKISGGVVEQPGGAAVALLTVQYHVPREVQQATQDLIVDLQVPHTFSVPRRIEPQGATWSATQSTLRWALPVVVAGASGVLVAAFRVSDGIEAAAAGLGRCHAMLRLRGEGSSITGVQLAQSRTPATPPAVEPGTNSWSAFVLARPQILGNS